MEPEVRYCVTKDGVRIAYTVTGEGPPIVFCVDPIASHVQLEWSHPTSSRVQREVIRTNTLIRFDFRGCGLSDRVMADSLDKYVLDIEAVVERAGFREFGLVGNLTTNLPTIVFAARHPEQVTRLVLMDGYLRGSDIYNTPQVQALMAAAKADWTLATEAIGFIAFGSGSDVNNIHGEYVRACIGPDYFGAAEIPLTWDTSEYARQIQTPTLVIKHAGLQFVTMEATREVAALIPNAQLAVVEGTFVDDIEGLVQRIVTFINGGVTKSRVAAEVPSGTAIILFADIVDSTALTERLGDTAFRDKARGLDEAMRAAIRENGGTPVEGKTLGDGVLAVFTSAKQAIACAQACHAAASASGLSLHAGIHAGDVIHEADNVYGGAVNIAARVAAASAAGETLVSDTVRSLARTSAGVTFEDRGEHALKGIAEPQRLFTVVASGQAKA
ncbi:MAG TPA: adenylate/guanylate cyclase domain-containing protein [Dehalococcoidia bacterium]